MKHLLVPYTFKLDEDIVNFVKREMNLAIGDTTAEQIKKEIG